MQGRFARALGLVICFIAGGDEDGSVLEEECYIVYFLMIGDGIREWVEIVCLYI